MDAAAERDPCRQPGASADALALAACEKQLAGRGACRIHGGGFAGTLLAFVPNDALSSFRVNMEAVLGEGRCHVLSIRQAGGVRLA